jgi:hypothetical protein
MNADTLKLMIADDEFGLLEPTGSLTEVTQTLEIEIGAAFQAAVKIVCPCYSSVDGAAMGYVGWRNDGATGIHAYCITFGGGETRTILSDGRTVLNIHAVSDARLMQETAARCVA